MNEIFSNAKNILIVWVDNVDSGTLTIFQTAIKAKAKHAHITADSVKNLYKSEHVTSSYDIILYDLIGNKATAINVDILNECFRLLHPNGYFIAHIEHSIKAKALDHFKMCGFTDCNPLDSNSSFLIDNKSDDVKQRGSLWLCQKPSFDVGYSVPLRKPGVRLIKQISMTGGVRRTWTVENDDDDDDEDDDQKPSSSLSPYKPGEHINFSTVSDV